MFGSIFPPPAPPLKITIFTKKPRAKPSQLHRTVEAGPPQPCESSSHLPLASLPPPDHPFRANMHVFACLFTPSPPSAGPNDSSRPCPSKRLAGNFPSHPVSLPSCFVLMPGINCGPKNIHYTVWFRRGRPLSARQCLAPFFAPLPNFQICTPSFPFARVFLVGMGRKGRKQARAKLPMVEARASSSKAAGERGVFSKSVLFRNCAQTKEGGSIQDPPL